MDNIILFWLLLAPIFVLMFFVKCMDAYVYKKEKLIKNVFCHIITVAFICEIFHFLTVGILIFILEIEMCFILISLIVIFLLFSVVTLLLMRIIENGMVENESNKTMFVTKVFEIDLKITCAFVILYFFLTLWNIVFVEDPEFVVLGEAKRSFSVSDSTQIIISVGLIFAAVLYKIRSIKHEVDTYRNSNIYMGKRTDI